MNLSRLLAGTLLLSALSLTSCGVERVPVPVKTPLPAQFRECAPRPSMPDELTDVTMSGLLLDYDDAWADCHDKLQRAWKLTQ